MEIHLIWAQEPNGGIGRNGKLPWHISEDLKNFKKITLNCPILMGRKTWDSLPIKPLPNRRNIILSSKPIDSIEVYHNIDNIIKKLAEDSVSKIFIIGGSSIYQQFFDHATHLHITLINLHSKNLDTFFPVSLDAIKKKFIKHSTQKLSDVALYNLWIKK